MSSKGNMYMNICNRKGYVCVWQFSYVCQNWDIRDIALLHRIEDTLFSLALDLWRPNSHRFQSFRKTRLGELNHSASLAIFVLLIFYFLCHCRISTVRFELIWNTIFQFWLSDWHLPRVSDQATCGSPSWTTAAMCLSGIDRSCQVRNQASLNHSAVVRDLSYGDVLSLICGQKCLVSIHLSTVMSGLWWVMSGQ